MVKRLSHGGRASIMHAHICTHIKNTANITIKLAVSYMETKQWKNADRKYYSCIYTPTHTHEHLYFRIMQLFFMQAFPSNRLKKLDNSNCEAAHTN